MHNFSNRLKFLRKKNSFTQAALANKLEVTQQAVAKWESGQSVPDYDTLKKLAELFNTSIDYLLCQTDIEENNFEFLSDYDRSGFSIPIIGTVKAGYNSVAFNDDYGVEYANVPNPKDYFYLLVRGDSMEPQIRDGALALVHRQSTLEDGDLGVIVYGDNEGTLKKYSRKGDTIILQPFNPDYETKIISGEDLNSVYIAGKVIETKTKW